MAIQLDMIPETGIESVDKILALVGALYVLLTAAQAFVPKDSPAARLLAKFSADLRGVLKSSGQDQTTPASPKDGHRKTKAKKKPT